MSRNILSGHPGITLEEQELRQTEKGKLILTSFQNRNFTMLIRGSRLLAAYVWEEEASRVGAVYLGKVKKVVKNIEACFVEIAGGELCYLSLEDAKSPFLVNRAYDGRLVEGDELPVQVSRDALKTKQASVTTRISLAGRFLVLVTGTKKANISAKMAPHNKKALLEFLQKEQIINDKKMVIQDTENPAFGIIIRTEAEALEDYQQLTEEFIALREKFTALFRNSAHRTCFSCLTEPLEPFQASMSIAAIREYSEVVTDLTSLHSTLTKYIHTDLGHPEIPVRFYQDKAYSLSKLYSLESRLQEAISAKVWLKSGGYLVIEPTEALTVIDVNSGKAVSGKNMEESFWKINMEAAQEIAIQLRLRNLSGIIIVDFINMKQQKQQEKLLQYLKQLVRQDLLTTTVVDITPLGLVELTRKKKYKTLKEQLTGPAK